MKALLIEALAYIVTMATAHGVDPEQKDLVRRIRAELAKQPGKRAAVLPVHPGPNATETQIYAYYKAVAPFEDLRFIRRFAVSDDLKNEIDSLLISGPSRSDVKHIQEKRRVEAVQLDRQTRRSPRPEIYKVATRIKGADNFATAGLQDIPAAVFEQTLRSVMECWK